MSLIDLINTIKDTAEAITMAVPSVIGCASALAAFLPAPEGQGFAAKAHKAINAIAFNFKHAKNATNE